MPAELGIWRWIRRPRWWLLVMLVVASCGGPPFNDYDPPPTFAYKYVAANPYLASQYPQGSVLEWEHRADAFHETFAPLGWTYESTRPSVFNTWVVVHNARWPALWKVESIAGCGTGSTEMVQVLGKLVEGLVCIEKAGGSGSMNPTEYWPDQAPDNLTFSFDPSEIPGGTAGNVYFVDEYGNVVASSAIWVDGNGMAVTGAPALDPGNYYVLVDFPDIVYDGVQLEMRVLDPILH
jgi:hypothetical protein